MADPILTDTFRVLLIGQGGSDLPEDRYVNRFAHIDQAPPKRPIATAADDLVPVYESFLNDIHTPGTAALRTFLPRYVRSYEIRVYDLEDVPPRVPEIRSLSFTPTTASGLPSEVACVSSMVCTRNLPRRRGRFYFGPLSTSSTMTTQTDSTPTRVAPGLINALVGATTQLQSGSSVAELGLAVVSQVDLDAFVVTGGWVDDAFDTQRSRGEDALARTTWGTFTS